MMKTCQKCGTQLPDNATTCTGCGAPVGAAGPNTAGAEGHKFMAILSYFGILVIIPILADKHSPFTRFHANQGLILFIALLVSNALTWLITTMNLGILAFIPAVLNLVILVLSIMGIVHAAKGQMKALPIVGKLMLLK